jgi:hypothetical protein
MSECALIKNSIMGFGEMMTMGKIVPDVSNLPECAGCSPGRSDEFKSYIDDSKTQWWDSYGGFSYPAGGK